MAKHIEQVVKIRKKLDTTKKKKYARRKKMMQISTMLRMKIIRTRKVMGTKIPIISKHLTT